MGVLRCIDCAMKPGHSGFDRSNETLTAMVHEECESSFFTDFFSGFRMKKVIFDTSQRI